MDVKRIGEIVREYRKSQQLTQSKAADLSGVGTRFLSELENGKFTVELGKVLQVFEALKIDPAQAFGSEAIIPSWCNIADNTRTRREQELIVQLSRNPAVVVGDIQEAAQAVNNAMAEIYKSEHCSVYLLDENHNHFYCEDYFVVSQGTHVRAPMRYREADSPNYFEAIFSSRTIDAHDARNDVRMIDLLNSDLIPLDCYSGLYSAIRVSGKVVGIVGTEHSNELRTWTTDEIVFHGELADIVAQTLMNKDRRRIEDDAFIQSKQREELEQVLNTSQVVVVSWENQPGFPISFISENIRQFGYTPKDFTSGDVVFMDIIYPDDVPFVIEQMTSDTTDTQPMGSKHLQYRILTKSGQVRWIEERSAPRWSVSNDVTQFHGLIQDITEQKETRQSLNILSSALEQSGSAVFITNKDGIIEYVNARFSQVTGYSSYEVVGKTPTMLRALETSEDVYSDLWRTVMSGQDWRGEIQNRRKNGDNYWALISVSPISNESGKITHFVTVSEDISEQKQTQHRMEQLAFYDTLTGLENRRLFKDRLDQAVKVAERSGRAIGLLYLDIDQFKRVNDTLGHEAGDALLKIVGNRLRGCVRQEDTVARLGGDEFTVILMDVGGSGGADTVARKILQKISQPIALTIQGVVHDVIVSASIGITLAPIDSIDPPILMKNADLAMYRAKEVGRNNYQFFTEDMNQQMTNRMYLENELRRAMERDEFSLEFQPLVRLQDDKIIAFEALLRWHHPTRGLVAPDQFISVAEDNGLIIPIGEWVLREACTQAKLLQNEGLDPVKVCVNLSVQQFRDPHLLTIVKNTLSEIGLEAKWLELEITESMLMDNADEVIRKLHELKSLGLSLAIDDFGTGYSSLSYLKSLPIDIVKVDRSFVRDIPNDQNDVEITAAVIAMAHKLKLKVVAEGVETEQQKTFLRNNACNYAQGFFFSQPLDKQNLRTMLENGIPASATQQS
jgi:y4mF family transcriptional regulator